MSRPVNRKCLECATLSVEDAIHLHGEQGDRCWEPKICHRRRSHYRKRDDINRSRRRTRRTEQVGVASALAPLPPTDVLEIQPPPVPLTLSAVLVLYREHSNAPVHAVAAEVWQSNQKVANIQAIHCMGMRGNQVTDYIQEMLISLHDQFGIGRFEDVIKEISVKHCPIAPCPLRSPYD